MIARAAKLRRDTLRLRIPVAERDLIDRAAAAVGKTLLNFILEAAHRAAEEALLGRALMQAGGNAYVEFLERLDHRPRPNERLRRTMRTKAPWRQA